MQQADWQSLYTVEPSTIAASQHLPFPGLLFEIYINSNQPDEGYRSFTIFTFSKPLYFYSAKNTVPFRSVPFFLKLGLIISRETGTLHLSFASTKNNLASN
jgi:hypothetical protein